MPPPRHSISGRRYEGLWVPPNIRKLGRPDRAHEGISPSVLLADHGNESDTIRGAARSCGRTTQMPTKKNRRLQHSIDRALYAMRNRIKRVTDVLTNNLRVATGLPGLSGDNSGS